MRNRPLTMLPTLAVTALALAGCSSNSEKSRAAPTTVESAVPSTTATSADSPPAAAVAAAAADAKRTTEGDLFFETVNIGGTDVEYALVVPPNYVAGKAAPVLFAFPPGGQDHATTATVTSQKYAPEATKRGWVVISPVATGKGLYYDGDAAALVPALLDALAIRYPPEGGKFFLAGVSNGGRSAFRAALDHPERFRSLVVFPGVPEAADVGKLAVLKPIPVSMFVGGDDSGWRDESEATKDALQRLGVRVTLEIRPGEGHIIRSLTSAQLFAALDAARNAGS